jgi:hypothetical protein
MSRDTMFILKTVLGTGAVTTLFQVYLGYRISHELETQKAMLQRGSAVHALQVHALTPIYSLVRDVFHRLLVLAHPAGDAVDLEALTSELTKLRDIDIPKIEAALNVSHLLVPPDIVIAISKFTAQVGLAIAGIGLNAIDANITTYTERSLKNIEPVGRAVTQIEVLARLLVGNA